MNYSIGDILVYIGGNFYNSGEVGHGFHFKRGNYYTISIKSTWDKTSDVDFYDSDILYFKDHGYGCFSDFADRNFVTLDYYRNQKINNILKG